VAWDAPVAPLPAWLAQRLTPAKAPLTTGAAAVLDRLAAPSAYVTAALRGEVDRVLAAGPGGHNHALNQAAYGLGQLVAGGALPARLAEDALTAAAAAVGLDRDPPRGQVEKTIRSGLAAGARHPRRVTQ
jgi:hypothetical protein